MNSPRSIPGLFGLILVLLALVAAPAALAQNAPILRLNAGGADKTFNGTTFTSDVFFSDSKTTTFDSRAIAGTEVDDLFLSERITNDGGEPFSYGIPVPADGNYELRLHFAETAFLEAGRRQFDVTVEGTTVLDNYDIFASAGGANTAVTETILNVAVNDGMLDITFTAVVERAKINAIEVLGTLAPIEAPFGVNAGGASLDISDVTFREDNEGLFLVGSTFISSDPIANTTADALYQAERFANTLRFVLPGVQTGIYTIELHFAETFHTGAGERLMDIFVEGELVLNDYDIFAEAGGMNTAVIEELSGIAVNDGILDITFARINNQTGTAKISGIAITGASLVSNESDEAGSLPGTHRLTAAYPNPFNPETQFTLKVAKSQQVAIRVFDLLGREVERLFEGALPAGPAHTFRFVSNSLPSGIYLIQAMGEGFTETQRVVLLK
ncbi:MAG: malectin domain-containing carbohydrate-binding protein [Rhodothermales bacterium]|nr:malectin domain-containing carbohydrate-binding protein [Rhodothermales bacterium]